MKRVIRVLLLMLIIPICVNARTFTYSEGRVRANNYINSYEDRSKYIMTNPPFEYIGGDLRINSNFTTGGMLNKDEYLIGGSYLSPGSEYWTMTPAGGENQYYISTLLKSNKNSLSDHSGVRVTEYVISGVQVTGHGTRVNPWEFVGSYKVSIGSNDENKGTVSPTESYVSKHSSVTVNLVAKTGYRYKTSTCGLNYNKNNKKGTLTNITSDISCLAIFDRAVYTFSLYDTNATTQANPQNIYLELYNNWFSNEDATTAINKIEKPIRSGYSFNGYYYNSTLVINSAGEIVKVIEPTDLTELNQKLTASWGISSYTCNAGTYLPKGKTSCETCKSGSYCDGGTFDYSETIDQGISPCPTNYKSNIGADNITKCYLTVDAGKHKTTATGSETKNCSVGTFSLSHDSYYNSSDSCTVCPDGYTSAEGATANTKCYLTVDAGKYKTTATGKATTNCSVGTFSIRHNSYYNSADSCTVCPDGYTSAAGATANTSCYLTVEAGKYKTTSTGKATTNCSGGTFSTRHNSYYNSADSCTVCPDGYTSAAGATANTSCYITVDGGKYKTSATGKATANCSPGTYSVRHTSYYNSPDSCTDCNAGMTSGEGATTCYEDSVTCAAGTYLKKNNTTCSDCEIGYYCIGGTYKKSTTADQGITLCPDGYTSAKKATANTKCYLTVPDGKYKTTAKGKETRNCSAGTYSTRHDSYYNSTDACSPCGTGKTSDEGATTCRDVPSTITCNAGYYLPANSTNCSRCTAGHYCPGGTWNKSSSNQGLNDCPSAPAYGIYYTSDAGASSIRSCKVEVAGGYYKVADAPNVQGRQCPAGTYKATHYSYYLTPDSCDSCPYGTTSPAGSTSVYDCGSGSSTSHTCPYGWSDISVGSCNCQSGKCDCYRYRNGSGDSYEYQCYCGEWNSDADEEYNHSVYGISCP